MISAAASNYNYQQPLQQQRNVSMPPLSSARVTSHVPTSTNNNSSSSNSNNKSSSYGSSGGIGSSGGTLSAPTVPQEGLRDIVKRRLFEDIFKDCMGMYKNVMLIVRLYLGCSIILSRRNYHVYYDPIIALNNLL
jgi:hypothetical protein